MKLKKIALMSIVSTGLVLGLASCDSDEEASTVDTYTYNSYQDSLGKNWNPHAWENNSESSMLNYIMSPLVDISIKDSEHGVYQWVYEMATDVYDVTSTHKEDLAKYDVKLPEGKSATDIDSGFVFEIKLNEKAKWENGEIINADTYIESMQLLLDPEMKNYRANNYVSGISALAGAKTYFYQGKNYGPATDSLNDYSETYDSELVFHWKKENAKYTSMLNILYLGEYSKYWGDQENLTEFLSYLTGVPVDELGWTEEQAVALDGMTVADIKKDAAKLAVFNKIVEVWDEGILAVTAREYQKPSVEWDTVGLYKVDDYTIRYVNETPISKNYFLSSLTSNWLVYAPKYREGFETKGRLKTTNYNTSAETTVSCGPYKLASFEADKQLVYTRNENWYGYTKNEETGRYESYTNFEVDGQKVQQYLTDKVVINVLNESAAKQAFNKGALDDWTPQPSELNNYTTSDQLYKVDETYTMSFFFNSNFDALKTMDESKGNTNSIVLSNYSFRKAFSLAINRNEWVTATSGYKPAFALLNSLYFYDAFENPESIYRNTEQGMKAIVELYGVEYGPDKTYKTLEEACKSINGYNLAEAKKLMKQACDELVAEGKYVKGEPIKIRIAYKSGALDSSDNAQVSLIQNYLNAAVEGSGFGSVVLEPVGNLTDRYSDVPSGEFAIGYGAWGGAAFYPFSNFQVYMDKEKSNGLNEGACWDPSVETFTINVKGVDYTLTYEEWCNSMEGTGIFANEDFEVKLNILSALEKDFLNKYYRIPLAGATSCSMLSYKISYYTENYNIMYDFGGFRLLRYNYTDAEWANYVEEQGGSINYAG